MLRGLSLSLSLGGGRERPRWPRLSKRGQRWNNTRSEIREEREEGQERVRVRESERE